MMKNAMITVTLALLLGCWGSRDDDRPERYEPYGAAGSSDELVFGYPFDCVCPGCDSPYDFSQKNVCAEYRTEAEAVAGQCLHVRPPDCECKRQDGSCVVPPR